MSSSKEVSRRDFITRSAKTAAGMAAAGAVVSNPVLGANDRINMAVIGIRSRGRQHYWEWLKQREGNSFNLQV